MFGDSLRTFILPLATDSAASDTVTIAVLSLVSAAITTVIATVGGVIIARVSKKDDTKARRSRRIATQHAAWEHWFLVNGIDPKKIKSGDEPIEEVRRVAPTL